MKVTFFSESPSGACHRYRVALPIQALNATGKVQARYSEKWEPAVAKDDLYVFHRNHLKEAIQLLHKLSQTEKRPVVYDMDDNIMQIPESNPVFNLCMHEPKIPWNQIISMRFASAVSVSCEGLRSAYAALNERIQVLPNCISLEECQDVEPILSRQKLFIFWGGSPTHGEDLEMLHDVIPVIQQRHGKRVEFVVMGDLDFSASVPVLVIPFGSYQLFQQVMRSCDIGLAPMVDNLFNRGKSDLRIKELASMRLAIVASPVGEYKLSDVDIAYSTTTHEWIEAISSLIDSPDRRREMSQSSWSWVQQWDIHKQIHLWIEFFEELLHVCTGRSSSQVVTVESPERTGYVPGGDKVTVAKPSRYRDTNLSSGSDRGF